MLMATKIEYLKLAWVPLIICWVNVGLALWAMFVRRRVKRQAETLKRETLPFDNKEEVKS